MAYKVVLQEGAILDAGDYTRWMIHNSGATPAERWLSGLQSLVNSLTEMPNRYRGIEEQDNFEISLRQAQYHSHRVIYHVNEMTQTVHVLRVYHSARDELSRDDIPEVQQGK